MAAETQSAGETIAGPKGGGALRGIGETLTPDLFTGTGKFTIPFALPAGRNGLQPNISAVYSTGHGNGPFGSRWALNVPGVARQTSHGLARYDASDTFLLSGAEELVKMSSGADRTTYRPRTEGLFAQIERIESAASHHDYWEVATKDGLVSRAGNDPAVVDITSAGYLWRGRR